jgi:hypothetical protein
MHPAVMVAFMGVVVITLAAMKIAALATVAVVTVKMPARVPREIIADRSWFRRRQWWRTRTFKRWWW